MQLKQFKYLFYVLVAGMYSCSGDKAQKSIVFKGVYSFGPEVKSFKDCDTGQEFWVTDNSKQLELKYSELNFEKPYEPVYVEIEGEKIKSEKDGTGSQYDSTLVVRKLVKITREIPQDKCN